MTATDWQERFLATTRGRVFDRLRHGAHTVRELAAALDLTDNAVRLHLQALHGDGLVRDAGARRTAGVGKPARIYEVAPDSQEQFSRAYAPVLRAVVDELARRVPSEGLCQVLQEAGRTLGKGLTRPAEGLRQQAEAAAAILTDLGGVVTVDESDRAYVIRGRGCPLSAATRSQPAVCRAVEALLEEATGAEVHECCVRNGQPQCRFDVGARIPST